MANSHLTEDLVEDILVRLPVKSLMRFRCVHKSWSSLFQNPNFIAQQHLFHQTQTDSSCLLLNREHHVTKNHVLSFVSPDDDYDSNCGAFDVPQSLNLDLNFFKEDLQDLVIGPCINGIICLFDYPRGYVFSEFENNVDPTHIALWNPALREFKILPKNPINFPYIDDIALGKYMEACKVDALGFGYDPKSNDYKVLRIVSFFDDYEFFPTLYEVYSLSTNSWRKIDNVLDGCVVQSKRYPNQSVFGEIYFNGASHWWGCGGRRTSAGVKILDIVSFDMNDEVFQIIPLPQIIGLAGLHHSTIWKTLTELNNSLAFVASEVDGIEIKNFDIWVMREYGVKESWTKQFTIGSIYGVERSLGFGKNHKLFLAGQNGELVSCDTSGQKFKNLQVKEFLDPLKILDGVIYVESLVSIRARNVIQN